MNDRHSVGRFGERKAAQFIRKSGYTVLHTNWRHSRQEVDIIAKDASYLVFFEVKTRSCDSPDALTFGRPARAVNAEKQKIFYRPHAPICERIRQTGFNPVWTSLRSTCARPAYPFCPQPFYASIT